MPTTSHTTPTHVGGAHGSLRSYSIGFILSIILTLVAYFLVVHHLFSGGILIGCIMALAVAQLLVQLVFFLHLGKGTDSLWNIALLGFAILTLVIVVGGSLWVMYHLNYSMSPASVTNYLNSQDSL